MIIMLLNFFKLLFSDLLVLKIVVLEGHSEALFLHYVTSEFTISYQLEYIAVYL